MHATADREHMAALELLAARDARRLPPRRRRARRAARAHRGLARHGVLLRAVPRPGRWPRPARRSRDDTVTELLDDIDARITSAASCARRCSPPPASSPASTTRSSTDEDDLLADDRRPLRLTLPTIWARSVVSGVRRIRVDVRDDPARGSGQAGDGDAVAAGEVGADLDVVVARHGESSSATAAPWSAPISSTSQPPGRIHRGASPTMRPDGVEPVRPGEQRAGGSHVAHGGVDVGRVVGDVRRVGDGEVERRPGRQGVEPRARGDAHVAAAAAEPGEVGAGDVEGVGD